jgi:hypothetical protein
MSDWYWSRFTIGGTVSKKNLAVFRKSFDDNSSYCYGDFDEPLKVALECNEYLDIEVECSEAITDMEELCQKFKLPYIRIWMHDNQGKFKHVWTPGMKKVRITGIDTDHYEYVTVDTLKNLINYAFLTKREAPIKMGDPDLLMQARVKELLKGTAPDPKEYLLRYIKENHPDDPVIPPFIVKG